MSNTLKFGNGQWATKKGSTLAYNDENGNFKPLPFDFSRGSTATRVNKEGLIETVGTNEPRIDFKDDVKGALLLEPSRTNLVINSQRISLSPTKNGTFTDNFAISPDGTQNATKLTATDTDPYFYQSVSFSAGSYTASIYVKGIGNSVGKDFQIRLGGSGSAQIEIPSEWTRIEYTATMTSGSASVGLEIPDPAVIGDEVLVWGWQIEAGSYATSYIPTQGSVVTRVIEVCNNGGNEQVINSTEGVLYVEIKRPINQLETSQYLGVSDGGTDNRFIIGASATSSNLRFIGDMNGVRVLDVTRAGFNKEDWLKIAIVWGLSEFKIFINGTKNYETTLSDNFTANTLNTFEFANGSMSSVFYGISKDVKIYNTALTDAELISLTS